MGGNRKNHLKEVKKMSNEYFHIKDDKYAYRIDGRGEVLVLFHGFTSAQTTWDNIYDELITEYQVLTIDLPGHGETMVQDNKTMEEFSDDFNALLDSLKITKIHLLGYSMGGRAALSFANYYPEKINSLILESASPGIADPFERQRRKEADKALAEKILIEGVEAFVDYWEDLPLFDTQKNLPETVQSKIREERLYQTKWGLSMALVFMGTGTQPSWWGSLKTIDYPLTLIVGEYDPKFIEINEQINQLYKDAKLYTIKEAGHCVHLEKEAEFKQVVRDHIKLSHEKNT